MEPQGTVSFKCILLIYFSLRWLVNELVFVIAKGQGGRRDAMGIQRGRVKFLLFFFLHC